MKPDDYIPMRPIPISDRLPEPSDCCPNPRTGIGEWCWGWACLPGVPCSGRWKLEPRNLIGDVNTHWLPHWALPLPEDAS